MHTHTVMIKKDWAAVVLMLLMLIEISTGNLNRLPDSNRLLQMLLIPGSQKRTKETSIYFRNHTTMQHFTD